VLWCYLRNPAFKRDKDYHVSADLTGQANHLGVTIEADIIKQKLPENNGGYNAISSKENPYGKVDKRMYTELTTDLSLPKFSPSNWMDLKEPAAQFSAAYRLRQPSCDRTAALRP
jgi:hypothetical protein